MVRFSFASLLGSLALIAVGISALFSIEVQPDAYRRFGFVHRLNQRLIERYNRNRGQNLRGRFYLRKKVEKFQLDRNN